MASKPLTTEAIALTEKKMDMSLDDIIKMSKNPAATKPKQQRRPPNKSQKSFNNAVQDKALKVRQHMGSRSSVRQGVLAQRRSNFQNNHFPLANEAARKAVVAPVRNRAFNGSMVTNKMKRASCLDVVVEAEVCSKIRSICGWFVGHVVSKMNFLGGSLLLFGLIGELSPLIFPKSAASWRSFSVLWDMKAFPFHCEAWTSELCSAIGNFCGTKELMVGAMPVQRKVANGGFVAKILMIASSVQSLQQDNGEPKPLRPQTLDSLFANMKEQRMRVFQRQSNGGVQRQSNGGVQRQNNGGIQRQNHGGVQRNGGGRPRLPWARGRFGN
ncbi:hypothetical protein Pint_14923 [Pistacia integerrima]|uniref:Uncharacterized protein n=1 Tax=Pistacia integerrima TaxID=434235 RepID=A0ACC0ZAS4_9ROSI|nr:hypothetical protein Pint_14923 [Pistacia integerrima]